MDKTISDNGCELRSLLSDSNRKELINSELQTQYTYYDIQPGDSLQGICLRYGMTKRIDDIKRINKLISDQDFYALRRLKLPLGRFGLLEELLPQRDPLQQTDLLLFSNNNPIETRHKSSPGSALSVTTNRNLHPHHKPLISLNDSSDRVNELDRDSNCQITIDDIICDEEPKVKGIFEDLDYHVEKAKAAAADFEKRTTDIVNRIEVSSDGQDSFGHTARVSKIPELFFSGENFGLNLKKLLILIFVVCLVIPFVYMQQAHILM